MLLLVLFLPVGQNSGRCALVRVLSGLRLVMLGNHSEPPPNAPVLKLELKDLVVNFKERVEQNLCLRLVQDVVVLRDID